MTTQDYLSLCDMKTRDVYSFDISEDQLFKKRVLSYFSKQEYVFFLDSNRTTDRHSKYNSLLGVGCMDQLSCKYGNAFEQWSLFQKKHQDWMFGGLGYDLKNELELLESNHPDHTGFPDLFFVVPQHVFCISDQRVEIHSFGDKKEIEGLEKQIRAHSIENHVDDQDFDQAPIIAGDSRSEYLTKAQKFLDHIQRGDIYEANFCTQFTATGVNLDSHRAFHDLNAISEPPFAAYARFGDYRVISASPERYLKKKNNTLTSQPIKGTARRAIDPVEDQQLKEQLHVDRKERSENVMIVDLVRNDLSRVATQGSVRVEELYGMYTFKQVHHMISTITAQLSEKFSGIDSIKHSFPMGSMTGAPKVSAMQIIEQTENFKRGLYSGAIGYMDPKGDFDFNVVIRTILFNKKTKQLSFAVGSAITSAAQPEKEYEECLLKARALFEVLEKQGIKFKRLKD